MIVAMVTITVLYHKTADSHFDLAYYRATHIPLVKSKWSSLGLVSVSVFNGTGTLDGSAVPYAVIGHLTFTSSEEMQSALADSADVMADIPNFTNVTPILQLCEPLQ